MILDKKMMRYIIIAVVSILFLFITSLIFLNVGKSNTSSRLDELLKEDVLSVDGVPKRHIGINTFEFAEPNENLIVRRICNGTC